MTTSQHEDAHARRAPGKKRRRALAQLKGRQVEPRALAEVQALLGERPRRRDLLIEHLHLLQDAHGRLYARHLAALAQEMQLALAEVWEVATFYHNFDATKDDAPAPALTLRVCDSLSCALAGSAALEAELAASFPGARVTHAACLGRCDHAPVVRVGGRRYVEHATAPAVRDAAVLPDEPAATAPEGFEAYRAGGGYRLLAECHAGARGWEEVVKSLEDSGLRGLGGAGFPTGRKWRFVRAEPKPRLMAVNADESEPGTFKDRFFLLQAPHRLLEGMLIAAWFVEAAAVYFYLRDEYSDIRAMLDSELPKLAALGLTLPEIHLRRGAGAYICGEESAMLESIEGKRGLPRHKPPFPSQVGLFGRPTLINNVETLYWVRDLIERGPAWFTSQGRNGRKGLRSFSVSGRVKQPGVKIAPAGISLAELIDEFCGGMADGHRLKGFLPGGASGGIFPASMADLPLDFGVFEPHGGFIGSAAVIVLSDRDSAADAALNLTRFFEDESCGQCTPCRAGTEKAVKVMNCGKWDRLMLADLAQVMSDASICGLGQAAANPLRSALKHFPEDVP
jgi:formate dehydrogenase